MPEENSQGHGSEPTWWTPRSLYPALPGHPVQSALREACCQRWDDAVELLNTMRRLEPTEDNAAKIKPMAAECAALLAESVQLLDWLQGEHKPLAREQADWVAKTMLEAGFSASDALDFARALRRRPRKRPADKRLLAIEALELQLASPGRRTWRELAKQTYGCRHEKACRCGELLRCEVGHLNRFLARMRIPRP